VRSKDVLFNKKTRRRQLRELFHTKVQEMENSRSIALLASPQRWR
jgi:hypothetical protein